MGVRAHGGEGSLSEDQGQTRQQRTESWVSESPELSDAEINEPEARMKAVAGAQTTAQFSQRSELRNNQTQEQEIIPTAPYYSQSEDPIIPRTPGDRNPARTATPARNLTGFDVYSAVPSTPSVSTAGGP